MRIASFGEEMMTNVGAADLVRRTASITRGTERREASAVERAAIAFLGDRTHKRIAALLVEISKEAGVRVYRPAVLQACLRALDMCHGPGGKTFHESAVHMREQNRLGASATAPRRR
jgi:hypothetical protein